MEIESTVFQVMYVGHGPWTKKNPAGKHHLFSAFPNLGSFFIRSEVHVLIRCATSTMRALARRCAERGCSGGAASCAGPCEGCAGTLDSCGACFGLGGGDPCAGCAVGVRYMVPSHAAWYELVTSTFAGRPTDGTAAVASATLAAGAAAEEPLVVARLLERRGRARGPARRPVGRLGWTSHPA